jgi:hypothetical protein
MKKSKYSFKKKNRPVKVGFFYLLVSQSDKFSKKTLDKEDIFAEYNVVKSNRS